LFLTASMV